MLNQNFNKEMICHGLLTLFCLCFKLTALGRRGLPGLRAVKHVELESNTEHEPSKRTRNLGELLARGVHPKANHAIWGLVQLVSMANVSKLCQYNVIH